jgi:NAD(P) transhydrogenase
VHDFDLLVIGSGPGGQKAAIAAAKLERRVAIVERPDMLGGVCVNTGTIPSKTMREAVLYLTGLDQREMYGQSYRVKDEITIADLANRTRHVVTRENDVVRSQLTRNRVTVLSGTASFLGPHEVQVDDGGGRERKVTADAVVIATGTRPARPSSVAFDEKTIIDSDGIQHLKKVPRTMVVAGAGVIGIEYASMFAALGCKVTVVEQRDRMLEFCDLEVVEALKFHLRDLAVTFRFGEIVDSVEAKGDGAIATLRSGKRIPADTVMYSAGRQGVTTALNLPAAGLEADGRGRIKVDEFYRTAVPHIYAVGDVIGFPRSMPVASRCTPRICSSRSAFTASRRSASSAGPRISSPRIACRSRSACPGTASWPGGRSSATPMACSSCWSHPRTTRCSGSMCSARRPPSWCTSARR